MKKAAPENSPAPDWSDLPRAADPSAARQGRADWQALTDQLAKGKPAEKALALKLRRFAEAPALPALLDALFGNSPYLGGLALAEPATIACLIEEGPEAAVAETMALAHKTAKTAASADAALEPLRLAKRRLALALAAADIAGLWPLERITGHLSDFAAAATDAAFAIVLREAAVKGDVTLKKKSDPCPGSGFFALGMGKLGARELNYSSDIDLIVLYDSDTAQWTGKRTPLEGYVRLTQGVVRILSERTEHGYVFRTDLRLRPDPGATPVALSTNAAETYYESFGQNWERAAMIKARPIAGDIAAGEKFLGRLTPYIWRKNLDFAAIDDIHSIKRQIHAHRGHAEIAIEGHNLKLGRGGIREIEFFAQTQQLISGGRDARLRPRGTIAALNALVETGRLAEKVCAELTQAYIFLRQVEHRLQMINDEQTHSLPQEAQGIAALALFLGMKDAKSFRQRMRKTLETVQGHYDQLFSEAPSLGTDSGSLVFTGADDDPETLATLKRLGFQDGPAAAAFVRGWHFGRYRAMRSERAREKLTAIMPRLLDAFSRTGSPDIAIQRFDQFLSRLPAGVQLFALLQSNPDVLDVLAELLAAAPSLAARLAENSALFDSLLDYADAPPTFEAQPLRHSLSRQMTSARDFQDVLDWSRRWTSELKIQIGIGLLRGNLDGEAAGRAMSAVADAVLAALLARVAQEFEAQHGRLKHGRAVLVGLGRLGSRELTLESDLDIILLFDCAEDAGQSDGARPLTPGLYYARLCQRLIAAITAMTGEGKLFDVDIRLRPSGNAGPVASAFNAYAEYQRREAWTWEHMALTRARAIAEWPAPEGKKKGLGAAFADLRRAILAAPRDMKRLYASAADMRRRIAEQNPNPALWNLKHRRGGLIDIEFITQTLLLAQGAAQPAAIEDGNPLAALKALAAAKALDPAQAQDLIGAAKLQGHLLALSRLAGDAAQNPQAWPPTLRQRVPALVGEPDLALLEARIEAVQATARAAFATLVEKPAAPYREHADHLHKPTAGEADA